MDQDFYRVEVLHHLDPYLIWVEVIKNGDIVFEQIGLYGILPLEPSIHPEGDITYNITDKWVPAANAVIKKFILRPEEIWFYPVHIDRRSSIFDNNIHKFGDLVIKKNNCEESLSKLVIQSGFGLHDISQFHHSLSCGNIKTKLSCIQTIKVIEQIASHYTKSNKSNSKWSTSLKKQTSIYNTSLQLETLTTKNLEKHNNYLLHLKLLEDKLDGLSMCKDVDEPSLGRASKKGKVKYSRSSVILERKLNLAKTGESEVSDKNDPMKLLSSTKEFIETHGIKVKCPDRNRFLCNVNNGDGNSEKEYVNGVLNSDKINIEEKNSRYNEQFKSAHKDVNSNGKANDISKFMSTHEDVSWENKQEKFTKSGNNTVNEVLKQNSNRTPNTVLVAYGPPECDQNKLPRKKILSVLSKDEEMEVSKSEEVEMSDRTMFENEKDPESDLDFTKLNVKVNIDITHESHKNSNESTLSENSTHVNSKKSSSLFLQRKLKQYKTHTTKKFDSSFRSDSDTTDKDTSSFEDSKSMTKKEREEFDFNDDISDVVKELNSRHAITKNNDNPKEIDVNYSEINVNPYKNLDGSRSIFVDKLVSPILMVHTKKNNKIQPYTNLRDVPFGSEIKAVLGNMSIKEPTRMQSVSWNTILRGHSVFMVGSLGCGKTIGYLPAVCRLVSHYHTNKDTVGPSCIIVCATAQSVSEVEKVSKMLLGLDEKVLACYVGVDELNLTTSLLNGCDLFICMPSFLVRLLHNKDFGIDLRSLRTFVIDDCERVFDVYAKEIKFAIHNIREVQKNRANKEVKVQFVAASRKWCDSFTALAKTAPDSVVCIGAFQECILYSKTNTTVSFVKNDNKINEALAFIQGVNGPLKTVIVCRFDDEVKSLERHLTRNKCVVFACDNTMTVQDLYNINISWGNYEEPTIGPILICCDENLSHMNVTDAHYLLHYSLPSLFSTFCKRFSVLNDNYPSIFKSDSDSLKIKVLLEEANVEQLPKILNFIKRCTTNVPDVLDEVAKDVLAQKDLLKATKFVPLCDSFLALGSCPDFWHCQERHAVFKDYDTPKEWVPIEGEIRFKILHYHTAVSFSARLISNTVNGECNKFPQTYNTMSLKMGMHFSKESNKKLHGIPEVGDVCAVAINQNLYVRCRVLKILNHYQSGKPNYVLIKLLDEEKLEKSRDIYLYHLPDNLRNIETHVVNIRLSNVKPLDKDVTFSEIVKNRFKKLTDENEELFMRGQIVLTVGNCVFVDTLEACQDLCSFNEIVVRHNFKRDLLDVHAVANDEHIVTLKEHCRKSNLIVKSDTVIDEGRDNIIEPTTRLPKGDWAYLDSEELSSVYLSYAENPDKFFLRHVKFEDCMKLLLKDIEKQVRENPNPVSEVNIGDFVLAKFPDDDKYERARIDTIIDENNVECFFVDQGDWYRVSTKHLIPITETLIQQLPYQAIECRLIGIQPAGSEWTDYSSNWFCDNCFEDSSGNMKQLFVKYYTKEVAEYTEGHKYGVAIIDTNTDKDLVINLMLVDLNLARVNENEIHYLNGIDTICNRFEKDELREENERIGLINHRENADGETEDRQVRAIQTRKSKYDFDIDDDDTPECDFEMNIDDDMVDLFKTSVPNWLAKEVNVKYPSIVTGEGKVIRSDGEGLGTAPTNRITITDVSNDAQAIDETVNASLENNSATTEVKIEESTPFEKQLRKPKLLWRQTKTSVSIKIILIGVDKYDLEFKEKSIRFSTEHNDTDYGFDIELYGVVDTKTATHSNKGQYILIKMLKLLKKNWLALTRDCDVKKWIVYDVDSIDASSDEEETQENTLAEVVKKMHEKDESDTEDEDFRDDTKLTYG